jgi:anti-sigma factor RsiW
MSANNGDQRDDLPPELLAAYADGELSPAECRRVAAWLAGHPAAADNVEAQRRLDRLFEQAAPPPPTEEQWAEALARVERGLALPAARRPAWRRRLAAALTGLAAAAALLLALARQGPPALNGPPQDDTRVTAEEPWPVASADDVQIISMDDRDRGALVVGKPPVSEPLELVTTGDVKVSRLEPDGQGRVGRLRLPKGSDSPMIVMSLDPTPEEEDP